MLLKLLPLAGFVCVSAHNLRTHDRNLDNGRSLQAAASCMAFGTPFVDCCPCAKPDDGVCTLLWCFDLNELVIQDECKCGQLADACDKLGFLLGAAEGLPEMCAKAKECCGDTEASNGDFDACIADVAVPDLARLIPGGVPDVSSMGSPVCADSGSDESTETAATQGTIVTLPTVPSEGTIVTLPAEPSKKTEVTTLPTEPSDGAAASCMALGIPFADCCPCAKPDDAVCTLLWCFDLNELVIHDECKCGQLVDACDKLLLLGGAEGLTEMCAKAKECCGATEASNGDFDACIADVAVPDLARLFPGGIPDVTSMGSPTCADSGSDESTETAATQGTVVTLPTVPSEGTIVTLPTVPSEGTIVTLPTEPSKETEVTLPTEPSDEVIVTLPTEAAGDTVPVTEAPKNTTETPEVDDTTPDDSPGDGLNGANKYTVGTLMTLVGSALSILFV